MRCVSNEKQYEKIKAMLDKGDFESINVGATTGATRYGTSMRGNSLDAKSAGPIRNYNNSTATSGSDGFGKFTTNDFNNNMQSTYLKPSSNTKNTTTIGS